jgi:hypothetical protein
MIQTQDLKVQLKFNSYFGKALWYCIRLKFKVSFRGYFLRIKLNFKVQGKCVWLRLLLMPKY